MPINYTESSETEPSYDSGFARAEGNYGVLTICFCGEKMKREVCATGENQGRKYYKCPKSEDGGEHLSKWWDDAIDEEFLKLWYKIRNQCGANHPAMESICESMSRMRLELDSLKEQQNQQNQQNPTLEALSESMRLMRIDIAHVKEENDLIAHLYRFGGGDTMESFRESLSIMRIEFGDLKERLAHKECEIRIVCEYL